MSAMEACGSEVLRICVLGAESSGTTTLARRLSCLYDEPRVDEYAREYTHNNGRHGDVHWTVEETRHIAEEQCRREDHACLSASRLIVCDTDAFTVAIWAEHTLGHRDPYLELLAENRREGPAAIALYLLTKPDFPYEHDAIRSGEQHRERAHERFVERLKASGRPWSMVEGPLAQRVVAAEKIIAARFGISAAGSD